MSVKVIGAPSDSTATLTPQQAREMYYAARELTELLDRFKDLARKKQDIMWKICHDAGVTV